MDQAYISKSSMVTGWSGMSATVRCGRSCNGGQSRRAWHVRLRPGLQCRRLDPVRAVSFIERVTVVRGPAGGGVQPCAMEALRELGGLVRRFRGEAGLSGAELARRAGVPQPSVSRAEAGRRLEDVAVVERLVSALGLDAARAGQLVELARRAYAVPVRSRVDAGVSMVAGQVRRYAAGVRRVRSFSSAVIPALLRTPDYARAAAENRSSGGDLLDLADLLNDETRSFVFVVMEAALRTWPGSVSMGDQLARVSALSGLPNVRLGVVPWRAAFPRLPLHDFTIFDDGAVWVETFTAELTLTHAADVGAYAEAFAAFQRAAMYGDQARAIVTRAAEDIARIAE